MKMNEHFTEEFEAVFDLTMNKIKPCSEFSQETIHYLKMLMFHVSYGLIIQYHNSLADALKEKGIDIGYLE